MRIGNLSELMGSCPPESLRPDPGPNDATRMDWRKGRGDAAARTGWPTFVRGQSRSANDWEPGNPVAKISTINFQIFQSFRNISFQASSSLNFRYFQVRSSFLISCHTKINKKQTKNEHSIFYFTTMAWEKFVEKYDDFMRNSKTKVKNEKNNKNYVFV